MFLLNIFELKQSIIKSELSESTRFKHFLIYMILLPTTTGMIFVNYTQMIGIGDVRINSYDVLSAIIIMIGVYYCYRKNGGKQGNLFLQKYFSIGFVILIRVIVIFLPLIYLMLTFLRGARHYSYDFMWWEIFIVRIPVIIHFLWLGYHMGDLAKMEYLASEPIGQIESLI